MTLRFVSPSRGLVLGHAPRRQVVLRRIDVWAVFNAVMLGALWASLALAVVTVLWTQPVAR